jgi:Protein of unknown function (DUF3224)
VRQHATGTIEGTKWDEQPWGEVEGAPRLTRVSGTEVFHGDIEGEGTQAFLPFYLDERSGSYTGMERVVGRVGGRSGSFVLRHSGSFEGGVVSGSWSVVPGSGTEELRGLRGEGGFVYQERERQTAFTLDYDFG